MSWQPRAALPEADVDVARLWAESGCQALTHADVGVPARLVTTLAGVIERLDAAGAGLADRYSASGLGVLSERAGSLMFDAAGRASCGGGSRLLPTVDDWVAVTLARPDDRRLLPAWLGVDPHAQCVVNNSDPWTEVARRIAQSQASEVVDTATVLGLACARVGEMTSTAPVMLDRLGDAPPRPLSGLRVVNLASLWAGPLAAAVLARLGADVVCVESIGRPDGARATPHWFDAMHTGQRSVAIELRHDDGVARLAALLAVADVVIEGSRPRALEQLGISATQLVQTGPRVWLSITGHGRHEPDAMRVALGDDAAAAGGLVGRIPNGPVFIADAIADPLTGLIAALTIVDLVTSGGRWLVDAALARTAATLAPHPTDPVVTKHEPLPPRPISAKSPPFELGAHNHSVFNDWPARR